MDPALAPDLRVEGGGEETTLSDRDGTTRSGEGRGGCVGASRASGSRPREDLDTLLEGFPTSFFLLIFGITDANKIDYILLSPDLYDRVRSTGVHRAGMWPGSRPRRWDSYPEVRKPRDAASDHAALWVDLDI